MLRGSKAVLGGFWKHEQGSQPQRPVKAEQSQMASHTRHPKCCRFGTEQGYGKAQTFVRTVTFHTLIRRHCKNKRLGFIQIC